MSEENSWIDFSNATPWEESISNLEDIFSNFHIGILNAEPSDSINHTDVEYEFEGLHYIISYYYSSYFCQWNEKNKYWPVYMIEMMDTNKTINYKTNDVSKLFDISEFIFIHLASSELRSYVELSRAKQLLSSAIIAMRSQEFSIPIFVECTTSHIPYIGYAINQYGENGYLTSFKSELYRICPAYCQSIPAMVAWFSNQVDAPSNSIIVSRSYTWFWFPSLPQSQWKYHIPSKEELRQKQPVLYMLQGFSSVVMWGPVHNPLTGLEMTIEMPSIPYSVFDSFDPFKASHFHIQANFSEMGKLTLTTIFQSLYSCWKEAIKAGPLHVLYTVGQRCYNQLVSEEDRNAKGNNYVLSSMMDLITGNKAVSVEAIIDAVRYIFKKGIQVIDEDIIEDITRHDFVPTQYLDHVVSVMKNNEEEDTPISLPERVITIPIDGKEEKWLLPEVSGSYHIPRQIPPKDHYNWVNHSAPPNSLITLLSIRCGEIVNDQPLQTLSLLWYFFVTVIETYYEHHKLLPHLGCVADNFDNISIARPPLPTFQYNLLHQKLTLLNCCIEEQRNNSNAEEDLSSDSDSPLYFSDEEKEVNPEEILHKPSGHGILNWSGWFLTGTSIPCWIPITKDKNILTEDKVKQQQELLAKAGSAVNEIRDEFVDTVADDIQAFKAANPQAQFEDFVRWHSPRDWSKKEGEVMGELSSRMQGNNPLRTLFDELSGVPAKEQKQFFNPDFEAELVLDYLRTLSPLTAMQNMLPPFLEATAYIFDHVDENILKMKVYQDTLTEYKETIKHISCMIDSTGVVDDDWMEVCSNTLMKTEMLISKISCLLEVTKGDWEIVNELLQKDLQIDLIDEWKEHRSTFIDLLKPQLDKKEADHSIIKLYAESYKSSQDDTISNHTIPSAHRLCVEKKESQVIVSSAISSCDIII